MAFGIEDQSSDVGLKPIVVDLDGTLLKSDILLESFNRFVTLHPLRCLYPIAWLVSGGKCRLKAKLAEESALDVTSLPYNHAVLAWLKAERARGRRLVLATASYHLVAARIADHLGIFDEVLATTESVNLKGEAKRDLLVLRFGKRGFDYVGNEKADLPIWEAADKAWLVAPARPAETLARRAGNVAGTLDRPQGSKTKAWIRALRLHQWIKNLLVFVPVVLAQRIGSLTDLKSALIAFLCFGLCASSVYLQNDMIDVAEDRAHLRKRKRPFANGDLSLLVGWISAPILLTAGFAIALVFLPLQFAAVLAGYCVLTVSYSLLLKKKMMVDVVVLALLYTIRLVAGAAAINVTLSFWLSSFSMFVFMSLALVKRYAELLNSNERGQIRKVAGRGYFPDDLPMVASLGAAAGYLSVAVLALYINDPTTANQYRHPRIIWMACPLLLYWVSRVWVIAHRGRMHDDPIVWAVKDRVSLVVAALIIAVFVLAL